MIGGSVAVEAARAAETVGGSRSEEVQIVGQTTEKEERQERERRRHVLKRG